MTGRFTVPTSASTAQARSARRGSSMADSSAMKPRYRNRSSSSEVSRASHTHQVPQVGSPHKAPLTSAMAVNIAPVGASAEAIMDDSRVRSTSASAQYAAITR